MSRHTDRQPGPAHEAALEDSNYTTTPDSDPSADFSPNPPGASLLPNLLDSNNYRDGVFVEPSIGDKATTTSINIKRARRKKARAEIRGNQDSSDDNDVHEGRDKNKARESRDSVTLFDRVKWIFQFRWSNYVSDRDFRKDRDKYREFWAKKNAKRAKRPVMTAMGEFCGTHRSRVFLALLLFRLINAFVLRTFFQPDEFFQSLEPAWAAAFGKDQGAWLTWEWTHQLRSSLHPLYFAAFYKVAAAISYVLGLPIGAHSSLLIAAPKIAQAYIAALGDFFTWKLAQRIYGDGSRGEQAALFATVLSPWQWFCSTRTFSNCLETTLTVIALNYWPWTWATMVSRKSSDINTSGSPGPAGSFEASPLKFRSSTGPRPNQSGNLTSAERPLVNGDQSGLGITSGFARDGQTQLGSSSVVTQEETNEGNVSEYISESSDRLYNSPSFHRTNDTSQSLGGRSWGIEWDNLTPPLTEQTSPSELGSFSSIYQNTRLSAYSLPFGRFRVCLALAALATLLRPTNVIIWIVLAAFPFYHSPFYERLLLIREASICGGLMLSISVCADRAFYGFWTFPPLNFLNFNIAQSLAMFYGMNRVDYYLTEGYPLLLTTLLPFALYSIYTTLRHRLRPTDGVVETWQDKARVQLAVVCILMPLVLSLIAHKEVRFIYPLLPSLHVLAAAPLVQWFAPAIYIGGSRHWPRILILTFIVLANIFIAGYVSLYHGSGVIGVVDYLRQRSEVNYKNHWRYREIHAPTYPDLNMTVGFLMPCHSTPWRSHMVHPTINAWALTCEPPINMDASAKSIYRDEADQFYDDPKNFLMTHMAGGLRYFPRKPSYAPDAIHPSLQAVQNPSLRDWPDYLIFFQQLEPKLEKLLRYSNYGECNRIYNSAWHDDWRRRGDVVVWCLDEREKRGWRDEQERLKNAEFDKYFDYYVSDVLQVIKQPPGWKSKLSLRKRPQNGYKYFWYEVVLPFWQVMQFFLTPFQYFAQSIYGLIVDIVKNTLDWFKSFAHLPETCGGHRWGSRKWFDIFLHQFGFPCPSVIERLEHDLWEKIKHSLWG